MYSVATYIPSGAESTSVTSGELCAARRGIIINGKTKHSYYKFITHTGNKLGSQSCYEGIKSTLPLAIQK